MIDEHLKKKKLTWKQYSHDLGEESSNFKVKFMRYVNKLNKWIEPLGLEVSFKRKKR